MSARGARSVLTGSAVTGSAFTGSALLGLVLSAAGCELTSVELATPETVVVAEVVLDAGAATQRAWLYTSLAGDAPLPGADIRVRALDDPAAPELAFGPAPDTACVALEAPDPRIDGRCYTADAAGRVAPGMRYALEVRLDDGRTLSGRTRVPGSFAVVRPAVSPCALRDPSLELVWTRSEGAGAYQIEAAFSGLAEGLADRGVEDPPDELRLLGVAIGAADTTAVFPSELGIFDRFDLDRDLLLALQQGLPDGARADVTVAAGDPNFVNWVRGGNFNPSGQVRVSSISGDGIGVFGSLVTRRLRLVTEPGAPGCR